MPSAHRSAFTVSINTDYSARNVKQRIDPTKRHFHDGVSDLGLYQIEFNDQRLHGALR
jgi:hypothetical protein